MLEYTAALKPLKWYKSLSNKDARLHLGAFLVEGPRAVEQAIASHPSSVLEVLYSTELPGAYVRFQGRQLTANQMRSVCTSRTPQDIAAVLKLPLETYSRNLPADPGTRVLLLEDIQDPGNTGTLIRTAAAFGFSGAIMTEKCADPFSPKCVQATAGSALSLWLRRSPHHVEQARILKESGYNLVAADLDGTDEISALKSTSRSLVLLGNEGSGLSAALLDLADRRVRIPIERKRAESLNVAACGAIFMYLIAASPCKREQLQSLSCGSAEQGPAENNAGQIKHP